MILLHKKYHGEKPIPVLINEQYITYIEPIGGKYDGSCISMLNSPLSIMVSENMIEISEAIRIKSPVILDKIKQHIQIMSAESEPVEYNDFPF